MKICNSATDAFALRRALCVWKEYEHKRTVERNKKRTGLRLSITNDIIKAHGGVLEIKTKQQGIHIAVTLKKA